MCFERVGNVKALYQQVPTRTVRSWRQRFAERADQLWGRLESLTVEWRGQLPLASQAPATAPERAVAAMGHAWLAARRRPGSDIPAVWPLANVIFGSGLLATRVDLPWPIVTARIGRFHPP